MRSVAGETADFGGMTLEEIGEHFGTSEATVCREVQAAIRRLWRMQVQSRREELPLFGVVEVTVNTKARTVLVQAERDDLPEDAQGELFR